MTWIVYIIKCSDGSLYTGITNNLQRRVLLHGQGKGGKYTRGRGPFRLIYKEQCKDRSFASKREIAIKKLGHLEKLNLVKNFK